MSRSISFFIFTATLIMACAPKSEPQSPAIAEVVPVVEAIELPDVVFLDASNAIDSNLTCLLEMDYENDTLQYFFNKEAVTFDQIPEKYQAWKQTFSEINRPRLTVNIKADKTIPIVDIYDIRLLLRQMNQLKTSYANRANERLLIRLPPYLTKLKFKSPRTPKVHLSNLMPPPPPPPPFEKLEFTGPNKACVFNDNQFTYKGKQYESCKACIVAAQRPYFSISLEKNQISLNGKALAINDLEKEMTDIFNTLYDDVYPSSPKIFIKMLILFKYDINSTYDSHLHVTAQLRNCYAKLHNRKAMELFNQNFNNLSKGKKRTIRAAIPRVIVEDIQ